MDSKLPTGRLTPPPLKAHRLAEEGVEILYSIPFDWDFASLPAAEFIGKVLNKGLGASHIVVGHDFRFGQLRKGAPSDIINAGIPVMLVDEVKDTGGAYSSSRIREHLRLGEIKEANEILGWEWEVWGEVVRGDRRGHDLGYPTANMRLEPSCGLRHGIYAVRATIGLGFTQIVGWGTTFLMPSVLGRHIEDALGIVCDEVPATPERLLELWLAAHPEEALS